MNNNKVIITCAITGSIHTPTMTPHLPVTGKQIADEAVAAHAAGAAIVHLHARDPVDGRPTQDPAAFKDFLSEIKERCDAVINITTGGSPTMSVDERLRPALQFEPEIASLNMGSMNFGTYEMLARYQNWKHEWEADYLAGSEDRVFRNTFKDIARILELCGGNGTRFEIECYDIGHLYTAAHFLDRKLLQPPLFIQSAFGIRGGIGTHPEDVIHMRRTADRLFGDAYQWSVLAAGSHQMRVATQAALMGGHVRVGLEDSLWLDKGRLASSNAEQVARIRQILESLGLQIATPNEARALLRLKGSARVAF
ncbi:3-keto-5-aminohexanoate cleavage protein [Variovorax sp. M-6]|uniref:3-keto-5-aminohexanoate cleavage protein n=1 Tax=Variovorax sp. M-6 TaxID=3233041 RepID=UPI003F97F4A1